MQFLLSETLSHPAANDEGVWKERLQAHELEVSRAEEERYQKLATEALNWALPSVEAAKSSTSATPREPMVGSMKVARRARTERHGPRLRNRCGGAR